MAKRAERLSVVLYEGQRGLERVVLATADKQVVDALVVALGARLKPKQSRLGSEAADG
jgi:hypothetical protein